MHVRPGSHQPRNLDQLQGANKPLGDAPRSGLASAALPALARRVLRCLPRRRPLLGCTRGAAVRVRRRPALVARPIAPAGMLPSCRSGERTWEPVPLRPARASADRHPEWARDAAAVRVRARMLAGELKQTEVADDRCPAIRLRNRVCRRTCLHPAYARSPSCDLHRVEPDCRLREKQASGQRGSSLLVSRRGSGLASAVRRRRRCCSWGGAAVKNGR